MVVYAVLVHLPCCAGRLLGVVVDAVLVHCPCCAGGLMGMAVGADDVCAMRLKSVRLWAGRVAAVVELRVVVGAVHGAVRVHCPCCAGRLMMVAAGAVHVCAARLKSVWLWPERVAAVFELRWVLVGFGRVWKEGGPCE